MANVRWRRRSRSLGRSEGRAVQDRRFKVSDVNCRLQPLVERPEETRPDVFSRGELDAARYGAKGAGVDRVYRGRKEAGDHAPTWVVLRD